MSGYVCAWMPTASPAAIPSTAARCPHGRGGGCGTLRRRSALAEGEVFQRKIGEVFQ